MKIIHYRGFLLAVFQVEGHLHITIRQKQKAPLIDPRAVLENKDLREYLNTIFYEYFLCNPTENQIKEVELPLATPSECYLSIIK